MSWLPEYLLSVLHPGIRGEVEESIVYPGASLQGTIPPRCVVSWKPQLVIRPLPRRRMSHPSSREEL